MAIGPRERALQVRPELLQPRAEPVDTFVRVGPVAEDTSLMDFAKGLSRLDASLGSLLAERKAESEKDEALKAEAAAYANMGKGFDAATKDGTMPMWASPTARKAYKKAEGDLQGLNLAAKFRADYLKWPGKDNFDDDGAGFQAFLGGWMRDNIGHIKDPEVLAGLNARLKAIAASGMEQSIKDRDEQMRSRMSDTSGARGNILADQGIADGIRTGKGTNHQAIFDGLLTLREEDVKRLPTDDVDKRLVDSVAAKALETGDEKFLGFMRRNVPGTNYSFGDTAYGRKVEAETIIKLKDLKAKEAVEGRRVQDEQDKKALADITVKTLEWIKDNPSGPIPEDLIKQGSRYESEFRTKVVGWRKTILDGNVKTDPAEIARLHLRIMDGGGMEVIREGIENGILASPEKLKQAMDLVDNRRRYGQRVNEIMSLPAAKEQIDTIRQRTTNDQKSIMESIFGANGFSNEGLAAAYEFRRELYKWAAKNPDADLDAQLKAIATIGSAVNGRITGSKESGGIGFKPSDPENPYIGPDGKPRAATAPGGAPEAQPPAQAPAPTDRPPPATTPQQQPQSPAPQQGTQVPSFRSQTLPAPGAPAPVQVDPKEATGWFNGLLPNQQLLIQEQAAKNGVSVQQEAEAWYRRGIERGAVKPKRMSFTQDDAGAPGPTTISYTQEDLDEAGRRVQDFVERASQAAPPRLRRTANQLAEQVAAVLEGTSATSGPAQQGGRGAIPQDFEGGKPAPGGHTWSDMAKAIRWGAKQIGAAPEDLATVISFESGFSTRIRGGAGNRHIGLIQFGAQEQKDYGADQQQTPMEQMQAVVRYLKHRGYKPGMSFEDLYSTINAGSPGLGHKSDAKNGGTWGTVSDKVKYQMAGHRAKALALLAANPEDGDTPAPAPASSASKGAERRSVAEIASDIETTLKRTDADTTKVGRDDPETVTASKVVQDLTKSWDTKVGSKRTSSKKTSTGQDNEDEPEGTNPKKPRRKTAK